MPPTPTPGEGRLRALDELRAVAVLLVLLRHMLPAGPGGGILQRFVELVSRTGWIGVDLFFVLSGFLVSGLLLREHRLTGSIDFRRFLARRGLKIYPAFYVFLVVSIVFARSFPLYVTADRVLYEALFLQNYGKALWIHTWSLAVEEHFYVFLSFLFAVLLRAHRERPFRGLATTCLLVQAGVLVIRAALAYHVPDPARWLMYRTHFRIDSLLFGVVLSCFYQFHREWLTGAVLRNRLVLALGSALCLLPAALLDLQRSQFLPAFGLTAAYLGCGGILLLALCRPARPGRRPPSRVRALLSVIGIHSYSIYLWHMAMRQWATHLVRVATPAAPFPVELVVYVVASVAAGIGMSRLVEVPTLHVRERFFPSRSGAPVRTA